MNGDQKDDEPDNAPVDLQPRIDVPLFELLTVPDQIEDEAAFALAPRRTDVADSPSAVSHACRPGGDGVRGRVRSEGAGSSGFRRTSGSRSINSAPAAFRTSSLRTGSVGCLRWGGRSHSLLCQTG